MSRAETAMGEPFRWQDCVDVRGAARTGLPIWVRLACFDAWRGACDVDGEEGFVVVRHARRKYFILVDGKELPLPAGEACTRPPSEQRRVAEIRRSDPRFMLKI